MTVQLPSKPELQAILAATRFLAGSDVRVSEVGRGFCELFLAFDPDTQRPGGLLSGMTLMGLADVAVWLAIMTTRGTEETWVTSDMKTAFLRSGRGEDIKCRASLLKQGARTAYATVETIGLSSGLLAHHGVTYAKVSGRQ